jgi:hypothetical protein
MPKYGCALLALPSRVGCSAERNHQDGHERGIRQQSLSILDSALVQDVTDDELSLVLVGLDNWKFKIQRSGEFLRGEIMSAV